MSNLLFFSGPLWHTKQRFLKIGSISFSYSTGSLRSSLTTGIGSTSPPLSWALAGAGRRATRQRISNACIGSLQGRFTTKTQRAQSKCKERVRRVLFSVAFLGVFLCVLCVFVVNLLLRHNHVDLDLMRQGHALEHRDGLDADVV